MAEGFKRKEQTQAARGRKNRGKRCVIFDDVFPCLPSRWRCEEYRTYIQDLGERVIVAGINRPHLNAAVFDSTGLSRWVEFVKEYPGTLGGHELILFSRDRLADSKDDASFLISKGVDVHYYGQDDIDLPSFREDRGKGKTRLVYLLRKKTHPFVRSLHQMEKDRDDQRTSWLRSSSHEIVEQLMDFANNVYYVTFLANAITLISEWGEGVELILQLYPGGGFIPNNQDCDLALFAVCSRERTKRVLITQPYVRDYLIQRGLCPAQKLRFVFGVVIPRNLLGSCASFPSRFLASDGTDREKMTVAFLCAGACAIKKGFDRFCRTIQLLLQERPDVVDNFKFVAVGARADGEWLINHFGLNNVVVRFPLIKEVNDLVRFYKATNVIFAMNLDVEDGCSHIDGFPVSCAIEGLLCGCHVMTTDSMANSDASRRPSGVVPLQKVDGSRLHVAPAEFSQAREGEPQELLIHWSRDTLLGLMEEWRKTQEKKGDLANDLRTDAILHALYSPSHQIHQIRLPLLRNALRKEGNLSGSVSIAGFPSFCAPCQQGLLRCEEGLSQWIGDAASRGIDSLISVSSFSSSHEAWVLRWPNISLVVGCPHSLPQSKGTNVIIDVEPGYAIIDSCFKHVDAFERGLLFTGLAVSDRFFVYFALKSISGLELTII